MSGTYVRPTLMFGLISLAGMSLLAVSISKMPKKERKGVGYAGVVIGLVATILSALYNLWLYAKETGMANAAKGRLNAWKAARAAPVAAAVPPVAAPVAATNVAGAPTVLQTTAVPMA